MKVLKSFTSVYLHQHWHVSLCVLLFLLFQYPRLDASPDYAYGFFIFFSTLAAYNLHDLPFRQLPGQGVPTPNGALAIGLIGAIISLFWLDSFYFLYILPVIGLTFLYILPVLPGRKKLRNFPWVKLFAVVMVIVYTVTIVPGSRENVHPNALLYHVIASSIFIILVALLFDIRDVDADKRSGIKSFPVFFGIRAVKILAYFLALAGIGSEVWLANQFILDLPEFVAIACTYLITLYFYYKTTEYPKKPAYSFYGDGLLALPYLLYTLLTL